MANEKIMNTRIQLKYDSYDNWLSHGSVILKAGEVAIAYLGPSHTDLPTPEGVNKTHPVLFKVGDGVTTFANLPWASALAADVYAWAKQENLPIVRNDEEGKTAGNVISSISWNAEGKIEYTTASVATSEGMAALQEALEAVQKDIADNRDDWADKTVDTNTDTQYRFTTDGDKLVIYKTLYTLNKPGDEVKVGEYEFLTAEEVATTLENYYTKEEVNNIVKDRLHTEDEIKTIAAAEIGRLIDVAGDEETLKSIGDLVDYVENNAGDIAELVTSVGTANTNASNAVETANTAASNAATAMSNAATALSTANEAKEAATTAQNSATAKADEAAQSAADAAAAKDAAEAAQAKAEEAQAAAEASNTSATAIANEAKETANAAKTASETATTNVTNLTNTINGYGDIVTHNVAEFATAAQGAKADTAVQPAALNDYYTKTEAESKFLDEAEVKAVKVDKATTADKVAQALTVTLNNAGAPLTFDGSNELTLDIQTLNSAESSDNSISIELRETADNGKALDVNIANKGVTTAKIADKAVGAAQTKAYAGTAGAASEEVWVFYCGTSSELV